MHKNGNRVLQLTALSAVMLAGMSGVCYANPVHRPFMTMIALLLYLTGPIVLFALVAGLFLGVRRLLCLREKTFYSVRDQLQVIFLLVGGFLISGFLVGIVLIVLGLRKAFRMYREELGPFGEDLLGRKRAANMLAAIALLVSVNAFFLTTADVIDTSEAGLLNLVKELGIWGWDFFTDMSREVTQDYTLTYPALAVNVSVLLGIFWLIAFAVLLILRLARGQRLRGAFCDGLAVFGYIILGNGTFWIFAGVLFYAMAIRHGCRVMKKYLTERMPQSGGDVTEEYVTNGTVPGDTE